MKNDPIIDHILFPSLPIPFHLNSCFSNSPKKSHHSHFKPWFLPRFLPWFLLFQHVLTIIFHHFSLSTPGPRFLCAVRNPGASKPAPPRDSARARWARSKASKASAPCAFQNEGFSSKKKGYYQSQRIHVWNIYQPVGIIWKITLGVNVGKYSSTMDP